MTHKEILRLLDKNDISFVIASTEDLLYMKENRPDKTEADEDDIRFLRRLIEDG